jgi:polyphosphate kinase
VKRSINREISWLSFNGRVLQEAADETTPLIDRVKFLGIYSNNLDEFFRVRVATLKRLTAVEKKARAIIGDKPTKVLHAIQEIVIRQTREFDEIYRDILARLESHHIFLVNEKQLNPAQERFVASYFDKEVRSALIPVMFENVRQFPPLKDHSIYLAVLMSKGGEKAKSHHALIEVPTDILPRFVVLPPRDGGADIILLDDVIRYGLKDIFAPFDYKKFEAWTIKLTRDAEIDLDDDITVSFLEKISKGIRQRKKGDPVRFVYDSTIPKDFLSLILRRLKLKDQDSTIPGGRYHNFKDFMNFPNIGLPPLVYESFPPLLHKEIDPSRSFFTAIREKDILLQFPYHSFDHVIDLLREAAIDPRVTTIKMTLYRVARNSKVVNALINAARNGKSVTVVLELQARFDEEANICWADRLKEEGVRVIHGLPNFKVHAKLCLIIRAEKGGLTYYANVGTGNFHEGTARVYSDLSLFTSDPRIAGEVLKVFAILESVLKMESFKHLIVSPFSLRAKLVKFINKEIANAREGREAYIIMKMNSLVDLRMAEKLYEASQAGVNIRLIVRGMCTLIPGIEGMSERISVISIVDRFLEHARVFVFCNDSDPLYYLSSADLMSRNLDRRIEVVCPVYDPSIQKELRAILDIQFADNVRARITDQEQANHYLRAPDKEPVRTQFATYDLLRSIHPGQEEPSP